MSESKRKTLMKNDLYYPIINDKKFAFLESTGMLKDFEGDKLG